MIINKYSYLEFEHNTYWKFDYLNSTKSKNILILFVFQFKISTYYSIKEKNAIDDFSFVTAKKLNYTF